MGVHVESPKVHNHYKETPKIPNQIHAHTRGNKQKMPKKTKTIKKKEYKEKTIIDFDIFVQSLFNILIFVV